MYLLYTDEVNVDPDNSEFFIYGGVSIYAGQAPSLSNTIDELRKQFGYRPGDQLKFNTRERPTHISPDDHKEIKRRVVEAAVQHDVRLFASFILHKIATSPEDARRNEINRVCYHFDCFLNRVNGHGLVLIDTFSDNRLPEFLRDKFSMGLSGLPYSPIYRLERVLGFNLATIGSSNFSSVVDIVLGSLRYAVNCRNKSDRHVVAHTLLQQLAPMCITRGNPETIDEISIFFSPKTVKVTAYQNKYRDLRNYLEGGKLGRVAATDQCGDHFI